jgi:hypothetical protein
VALNLRRRYLRSKDFLKKTCGSIAIQSESFWRRSPDHGDRAQVKRSGQDCRNDGNSAQDPRLRLTIFGLRWDADQ